MPNSVLCTNQAPSPSFSALHPVSALNPRTLHAGTTVLDLEFKVQKSKIGNRVLPGFRELKAVDRPSALYPWTTV